MRPQRLELRGRDPAGKRTSPSMPSAAARSRSSLLVRRSGSRARRAAGGARAESRASASISASRFLCGRLADRREEHRALAELEPLAHLVGRRPAPRAARRRARAGRRRSARAGCRAARPGRLRGALRVGDHAVRAARARRHQHAHALVAQAGVGLGEAGVDQVVHRHDATERARDRAPWRRGCARGRRPRARRAPAAAAARRAPTARGCERSPGR